MYTFCTYFDVNYLLRGLALHASLRRHAAPFRLYVLCLDDAAFTALSGLALPEIVPVPLAELEAADPELAATKASRSIVEYYFTCTAAFIRHLLARHPELEQITYLDADLYFYGSPAPIYGELGNGSVMIVEHRFPEHLRHLEVFGKYNVGLLVFRNNAEGHACLEWWRERCIEWCHDRLEDGRFGDQKYLDDWTTRFNGVVVLRHKGANLAPWNLAGYTISVRDGRVMVDDVPLIFYHFHKLKAIGSSTYDAGLSDRRARMSGAVRSGIYAPYVRELRLLMRTVGVGNLGSVRRAHRGGLLQRIRQMLDTRVLIAVGAAVVLVDLWPVARGIRGIRRLWKR
ncbi:MAG TPA: glycosyl transferase [Candidatus Kapabacteria bacterium]|nr:glycosyl transferase [Candidatus Kapabacteria bacterium]